MKHARSRVDLEAVMEPKADGRPGDIVVVLVNDPARAVDLPIEAIPGVLAALRSIELVLLRRYLQCLSRAEVPISESQDVDVWLTSEEVAARLKRTRAWVYRQARHWPFAKRPSRKTLLISERGLTRWLEHR